jgi:hypothetical protein
MDMATMATLVRPTCDRCGAPANVHISDIVAGEPVVRRFCPDCADEIPEEVHTPAGRRSAQAAVLLVVGGLVLFLSLTADVLKFGASQGFGVHQWVGVSIGGLVMLLGAVTRAATLLMIGAIGTGLAFLADWLAFGSSEGFGLQQIIGCMLGLLLLGAGIYVVRPGHPV